MNRKVALVTGGTSGIGLSIVRALAKEEYEVNFIGRNVEAGKKLERDLKATFYNENIRFFPVDLGNLKEVEHFVTGFKKDFSRLDLLANVAGVLLPRRQESADGFEKTFAVSYLSVFYMTNELIPLLKNGEDPRIVNVGASPSLMLKAQLDFSDLNSRNRYNGFKASTLAVHAKTVFTQTLSDQLKNSGITVNSFHPGNVKSGLFRNMSGPSRWMMKLFSPFFQSESENGIFVCLDESLKGITGKLIADGKPVDLAFDQEYRQQLWEESVSLIRTIEL